MKAFVVYYSRTGFTAKVASEIAAKLSCEVEEVVDMKNRSGLVGYLMAGRDAMSGRLTEIKPTRDPSSYDIVVIGTPIWGFTVSSPVRTYLKLNKGKFKSVAFFCTMGGSGDSGAFKAMEDACGIKPKAKLALKTQDVAGATTAGKIEEFVKVIKT
jgi:flavodoxin